MLSSRANLLPSVPLTETTAVATPRSNAEEDDVRSLTSGLARGDEALFCEFHARYFRRLYGFLLVVCRGQEDQAREALQQTLLRVARYARPFQSEEVFWSWLTALARSSARDAGRKERRYLALLQRFALGWWQPGRSQSADEDSRLRELVAEALDELPPEERRLVAGKYLSGESVQELAEQTGLSEKAVESRLVRSRRVLRELLLRKLHVL